MPRDEEEGSDVPVSHNAAANILGIEDSPTQGEGIVVTVTENGVKEVDEDDINSDLYDPMRDLHNYQAPTPALLRDHKSQSAFDEEEIFRNKEPVSYTHLTLPTKA